MAQAKLAENVVITRSKGGIAKLDDLAIIRVTGEDATSYLQGRTSNDVNALNPGQGQLTSLLHRKGHVQALFSLHKLNRGGVVEYLIVCDRTQVERIVQELETYLFRERVQFGDVTSLFRVWTVQGALSASVLQECGWNADLPDEYSCHFDENSARYTINKTLTGENGFVLLLPENDNAEAQEEDLRTSADRAGLAMLTPCDLETLRIEAGIPMFGREVSEQFLLPETALESVAASYNKGCFQGQEVLARIKTYGAPKQALVGIIFRTEVESAFRQDSLMVINGQEVGVIKSNVFSPSRNCHVALTYIAREYRIPGVQMSFRVVPPGTAVQNAPDPIYDAVVAFLPLYTPESNKERAKRLYDSALAEFAGGSEAKSIEMLRHVVECDPHFADAYESLGVILSRQNQLDEAIALMHRLAELDPLSIMAHANLSLYYMQLNEIEKAEEEKAIAMSIRMSQIAREVVSKKREEEERQQKAAVAQERIDMFQQVLNIDEHDLLANYGMGSALADLGKPAEAVPFLAKAIQVKPGHTVAWLALGKAFEDLADVDRAIQTYEQGIATAAKRGDITPMNEMKARMVELRQRTSTKA